MNSQIYLILIQSSLPVLLVSKHLHLDVGVGFLALLHIRREGDLSAGGAQGRGRRSGRRSRPPIWAELIWFFKPTTKIGEIILKSESVLSWCSWLFCITCRSSWKGWFGERSWHEINLTLIQKYKLKRTSWDEIVNVQYGKNTRDW